MWKFPCPMRKLVVVIRNNWISVAAVHNPQCRIFNSIQIVFLNLWNFIFEEEYIFCNFFMTSVLFLMSKLKWESCKKIFAENTYLLYKLKMSSCLSANDQNQKPYFLINKIQQHSSSSFFELSMWLPLLSSKKLGNECHWIFMKINS